jgi:tetratricopeptide (TPR) repeat protein
MIAGGSLGASAQIVFPDSTLATAEAKMIQSDGYFLEGMKFMMLEDYDKALLQFKLAKSLFPDNAGILFQMGRIYAIQENYNEALIHINLALEQDPLNIHIVSEKARVQQSMGLYVEAAKLWEQVLSIDANNFEAHVSLSEAYQESGDKVAAADALIRARQMLGFSPGLMFELQRTLIELGNLDEAIKQGRAWIVNEPENADASLGLAELYLTLRKPTEAAQVLNNYLEVIGENGDMRLLLSQLEEVSGNSKSGMDWLALMNNPQIALENKLELLDNRWEEMLEEEADTLAEALIILQELHPNQAEVHALQGDYFIAINRYKEAMEAYQRSLSISQNNYQVWQRLLLVQMDLSDYSGLTKTAEDAMIYYPSLAEPYYLAAYAWAELENFDEAELYLSSALLYNAGTEPLETEIKLLELYLAYRKNPNASNRNTLLEWIEGHLDNGEAQIRWVELLLIENQYPKALTAIDDFSSDDGLDVRLIIYKAEALRLSGDVSQAITWLKENLNLPGALGNGIILEKIGDNYLSLGNEQEARNFWKEARDTGIHSKQLLQKLEAGN